MTHYGELLFLVSLNAALVLSQIVVTVRPPSLRFPGKRWLPLVVSQLPAGVIFGAYYLTFTVRQTSEVLAGRPPNPMLYADIKFLVLQTMGYVQYIFVGREAFRVLNVPLCGLLLIGLLAALIDVRKRWIGLAFVIGLGISYLLSSFGLFVYADRHLLFLAPLLICLVAWGGYLISRPLMGFKWGPWVLVVSLGLLLAGLASRLPLPGLKHPQAEEEYLRPVLACVAEHYQSGDQMYVYYGANPAFSYYNMRYQWPAIKGPWLRANPGAVIAEARQALTGERGWIIFSHIFGTEDRTILDALEAQASQLEVCDGVNAKAVLLSVNSSVVDRNP